MSIEAPTNPARPKTQTEIDEHVLNFLGNTTLTVPEDLITLKGRIINYLESRPYNEQTKDHADSIQWTRTASEILQDGYVYEGKSCSDLTVVFLTLCKAAGVDGRLVKLSHLKKNGTHSIAEVLLEDKWYTYDIQRKDSVPVEGALDENSIYFSGDWGPYKLYQKGRDVWDLGLTGIATEAKIYQS